jgi:hypothetical protein
MRLKRVILWIVGTLIVLIGMVAGFYCFGLDWQGRPCCHKLVMLSFLGEMHPAGGDILHDPRSFPNVNGSSLDSLATVTDSMGYRAWTNDYNYVPGLREDDPPDLVLMYFNRPTRWNWHGAPPSIFNDKAWIVIPVDFEMGADFRSHTGQLGECSERVSLDEFRVRLRRTLDFIRTNQRPNWQVVVAEHEKFLNALGHQ